MIPTNKNPHAQMALPVPAGLTAGWLGGATGGWGGCKKAITSLGALLAEEIRPNSPGPSLGRTISASITVSGNNK